MVVSDHDFSTISVDDTDSACRIMLAHYFHHLTMMNRPIFICIAIVYARHTNVNIVNLNECWLYGNIRNTDDRRLLPSILIFMYSVLNWLSIRYKYQLPFNLLLMNIVMVIKPINFFDSLVRSGKYILAKEYPATI